jgi:Flp pilus assembly protein TadD
VLTAAHRRHPADRELLWILALINRDRGNSVAAGEYARKLYELAPQDPRVQQLLRELETGSG